MTDINFLGPFSRKGNEAAETATTADDGLDHEIIELLFFAYRDFVGEADHQLEAIGFGRAHHRVVYFVSRRPGLRVTDLLDILKITKQSLSRVLKQLVDEGFIEQRAGSVDRRERLLYATDKAIALVAALSRPQDARIRRALAVLPPGSRTPVRDFLANMMDSPLPPLPRQG